MEEEITHGVVNAPEVVDEDNKPVEGEANAELEETVDTEVEEAEV